MARNNKRLLDAINGLADVLENGNLLSALGGEDLLIAATEEIKRLRAELEAKNKEVRRLKRLSKQQMEITEELRIQVKYPHDLDDRD